ncbi:hypothetical protein [Myxococcus landrumensis]|uniref:Transcriptional regulator n=1 Tax=Myxococcus landrumensis TaxID=2813577 RepID=A0ABX7N5V8_9BACT|nr:hypothetical protein [Myxococcus landrumus]QSQ14013.1 hypothetical protein JY572_37820 [Myxococcus landrumus]
MAAHPLAARRSKLDEFVKPEPGDEIVQRPVRLPARLWEKIDALAAEAAKEGKVSPHTRRPVSGNDITRSFIETGLRLRELSDGEVRTASTPAAKKPSKKGGKP